MDWHLMGPTGVTREMWVAVSGPTKPEYGDWRAASGADVRDVLEIDGPPGVQDVEWYFMPLRGNRGKRLVDAMWQYGHGLKVYSSRMCAVLESCGARLQTWPADIRHRDGTPVQGYLSVLEEVGSPGPVHSMFRGRREGRVVVNDAVRAALLDAGITGMEFEPAASAFPGDSRDHSQSD